MKKGKKIYKLAVDYVWIFLGVLLVSVGLKAFLLPNGFLDGGVTGLAILINSLSGINVSLLLFLLSLPFLVLAYFKLSKRIMLKSLIGIITLAISIQLETFEIITEDKLLVAVFGGLFVGLGMGIAIRNGAALDGSEVLGVYLNRQFGINIGKVIILFNIMLFASTAAFISIEVTLYSILTFLVTAKVTDLIIEGFEDFIGVMIVSEKSKQVSVAINQKIGAGLTVYKGEIGIGRGGVESEFNVIHTIVNRIDIRRLNSTIDEIDPDAFVVEYDVNKIKGGVMRRYVDMIDPSKVFEKKEKLNVPVTALSPN